MVLLTFSFVVTLLTTSKTKSFSVILLLESTALYFKLYFPILLISYSPSTEALIVSLELSLTLTFLSKSTFVTLAIKDSF